MVDLSAGENIAMVIPETLLPKKPTLPERNLLVAMLHRALLDYFGSRQLDREDAEEWLFEESDERDAFSFEWVCAQLDLNPNDVLTRINKTKFEDRDLEMWGMRRTA